MIVEPLDDDEADEVFGRVSDARAARLLGQVAIRTEEPAWTPALVKDRLREAARMLERVVRRPGPSSKSGMWPDPDVFGDISDFDRQARYEGEVKGSRGAIGTIWGGSAGAEISRAERAILWPARFLNAPEQEPQRQALKIWLWCEASDQTFERFYAACGCSRATAYRRRDVAFETICEGLKKDSDLP